MAEVNYKKLIESYANDSFSKVVCAEINGMAQVISVEYDTIEVSHVERDSFKDLFYDMYADGFIEGIENYDYVIVDEFEGLAEDLLKFIYESYFGGTHKYYSYISYVATCNEKGIKPKYYYEWHTEGE